MQDDIYCNIFYIVSIINLQNIIYCKKYYGLFRILLQFNVYCDIENLI
ncbi:hypothetical protein D1BOALGB6SA_5283 [Olavius sp. associated proteobacterium Delta 1]|nr:hypothetical protein D1BOALGB6SA_5283 [Olavius sp. associated proteobacterium Delta 1]